VPWVWPRYRVPDWRAHRRSYAVDVEESRLAIASALGASCTVNAQQTDAVQAIKLLTAGRGADIVLEAAGNEAGLRTSVEVCRPGGEVVWLGKVGVNEEVAFRWGSLMQEKRITRSSYGGAQTASDFPALARSYLSGALNLDELISRRICLDEINSGFDDLRARRGVRSVIMFDDRA
jgi:S-(hydroxymethyl)glutathione dehydrogenase/alcohol dehydrogenase